MKKKINKYDILLIVVIIITNAGFIIFGFENAEEANAEKVYIYSNNEMVGEYVLTEDYKTEFTIESDVGYNTVHIENGEVWISDASCPDKICLSQGKISSDGEIIVCIPNKLSIKIIENEENDIDFIAN